VVFEALPSVFTDLHGNWESYKVNLTPFDWMLESGDRFQATFIPEGEVLAEPFEISDGVTIPVGEYHWSRVRAEVTTAPKRTVSGSASWSGGGFYDGTLQQVALRLLLQPSAVGSLELTAERNAGDLPDGDFTQDLASARLRINFSPDLQLNGLVQYDNITNTLGANTRVRWSFSPYGDVFAVYNYNTARRIEDGAWAFELGQLLLKAQYAFRF
jgi:hypothetical protein